MPISEARKRANIEYNRRQDSITIRPPKDEGARIRAAAEASGQSLQRYILAAVGAYMERDSRQKSAGKSIHIGSDAWEAIKNAANSRGEKPSEYVIRVISEALERDQ